VSTLRVLFVHGMGRTSVSGWPLLIRLRREGFDVASFSYSVAFETFSGIAARLSNRLIALSRDHELIVIGHSLGGVLARAAIAGSGTSASIRHLFLLGSPVRSPLMARKLASNPLFRALTRDCGGLLGSHVRMAGIDVPSVQTTAIVGTAGPVGRLSPFENESNDGVVSISETQAEWLNWAQKVDLVHTFLPSSARVARVIIRCLAEASADLAQAADKD